MTLPAPSLEAGLLLFGPAWGAPLMPVLHRRRVRNAHVAGFLHASTSTEETTLTPCFASAFEFSLELGTKVAANRQMDGLVGNSSSPCHLTFHLVEIFCDAGSLRLEVEDRIGLVGVAE